MHLVRAPDRLRAGLRELQVAHLALLDEPLHGAHRVLDRHGLVHAVHAVDVDHVHAEALQALLARLRHVVGMAAGQRRRAAVAAAPGEREIAELGRDQDLVAPCP